MLNNDYVTSNGMSYQNSWLERRYRYSYYSLYLYIFKNKSSKRRNKEYGEGKIQFINMRKKYEDWFGGRIVYLKEFYDWIKTSFIQSSSWGVQRRKYRLKTYLKMVKDFVKMKSYKDVAEKHRTSDMVVRLWVEKFGVKPVYRGKTFLRFEEKPSWIEEIRTEGK